VIPSEIGCTLSHLKAFKYIIDNKLEAACILEDDVILGPRFIQFIESINTEDQKIIGMMFLFSVVKMVLINRNILQRVFGSKKYWRPNFLSCNEKRDKCYQACSYIVSSDFAEKTIQLFESKYFLADEWGYFKDEQLYSAIYISIS
jgi:glycosyl transferase family 25